MSTNDLKGLRVLIVEDDAIIAVHLANLLRDAGCEVVGPISTLETALELARHVPLDAAVLDVNIDGVGVFPVATELRARGIPFTFATGYGKHRLPLQWREAPCLYKPFEGNELTGLISQLVRR